MGAVALLGFAAFVAVSLSVGLRLLRLAARTRELPELAIGVALFAGGVGYSLFILMFSLRVVPEAALPFANAVAVAGNDAGVVFLVLGVWKIFRPGRPVAAAAFFATAAAMLVHYAASLATFEANGHRGPFVFWLFNAAGAAAYAWSAFEAFRYHELLRRRVRVGLARHEIANRFLLWGCAGVGGFAIFASGMLSRVAFPDGSPPAMLLLRSLMGLGAGICIWLAFFPPRAYVRRIARSPL